MTTKRFVILVFALVFIMMFLLIFSKVTATPNEYYSNSIMMDGTYDSDHAMFSWQPSLIPGYDLDTTNIYCVGSVRVNLNTWKCVEPYQWYYEPGDGKYYFTAPLDRNQVCGLNDVMLQPWLHIYNPTSGAHDTIYGNTVLTDFTWCGNIYLPIIRR